MTPYKPRPMAISMSFTNQYPPDLLSLQANERLSKENGKLRKDYEVLYESWMRSQGENEKLHRENAQLCTRDGANTSIVSGLQKRYATLEKENKRFKEAYRVLYESWMRSQEENRKLQNELDIARQTILHLDGWLKERGERAEELRRKFDREIDNLTEVFNEKNEKIKELKGQLILWRRIQAAFAV